MINVIAPCAEGDLEPYSGKIKGAKAGKGWRVLKSELIRFLKGGNEN